MWKHIPSTLGEPSRPSNQPPRDRNERRELDLSHAIKFDLWDLQHTFRSNTQLLDPPLVFGTPSQQQCALRGLTPFRKRVCRYDDGFGASRAGDPGSRLDQQIGDQSGLSHADVLGVTVSSTQVRPFPQAADGGRYEKASPTVVAE